MIDCCRVYCFAKLASPSLLLDSEKVLPPADSMPGCETGPNQLLAHAFFSPIFPVSCPIASYSHLHSN